MTDKIEIYRARNELKGTRERETERTKGDLLCEFEIEDQYSAKQEREREGEIRRAANGNERAKRTRETKVRKHVSPGLLLLLLPAASGGAFKRTLPNCTLDGRNFSAGVVVSRKVTLCLEL